MDLKDSTSEGSMGSLQPSSIQIFANTTTLHGIRHVFVYGPVTIRRLLWTLAFVGSLGLLLVESSDRVAFYFSYQHVTKVDEVVANSLVFPAVTICNLNEFRFSRLTTNDLYHAGELLALLDVNLQIPNPQLADPTVLAILQEKANFKQYKPKVFSMQEFLARVGHDLKDMMLYCKFRGQECNHKDFKTLPLDGSNMKPQTPQVCGVAMQGGGEALNPILGTTPSSDHPSQGGCHCGCLQHRHCPGGATCSGIAVRRGQWFRSDCRRSRAATALNPPGSCEEPVPILCFEERSLHPSLDSDSLWISSFPLP
ncbi:acid-sensing ion channel 2-like [Cyanistes caeruleus]|uniref:acid-sensing ion channel 2-like n=1 Tax=Cyanistes caeruleus TaxID=156563 RepID=UPI000CDA5511|nr:acid-sensing ion channel 2-like [Cyanistes caeruleus]